jgi:uncharacterized protein
MPGSSFFALLDDIATLLDDVSVMTKVATKKTAGVLGDDLALNAQQVAGVNADRELPVVWAVAKGSAINKVILVPAALIISVISALLVKILLMIGGAFLCYEGVEKLAHKFLHSKKEDDQHHAELVEAVTDEKVDMVQFEKDKIKGAVRTDFILSAEIIVISLGTIAASTPFINKVGVLVAISIIMTVGVYGLVAGIVKLDDLGVYLMRERKSALAGISKVVGKFILWFAPKLMRFLSFAGTAAMFLVGGHIIVEGIPALHHFIEPYSKSSFGWAYSMGFDLIIGIICGAIVLGAVMLINKLRGKS